MASAVSLARSYKPLLRPVCVPANETWIAPTTLDRAQAETRIRDLVLPHLTHRDDGDDLLARISPSLLYVPFWRVKLAVPAIHLATAATTATTTIAIGALEFPMPAPSYGGRAGVLMISARTAVPYEPRLPTFFGGTDALEVDRADLLPATNDRALSLLFEGDCIEADVDRASGERAAASALVDLLQPQRPNAVRYLFNPRIESTHFVLYPLFHASFRDDEHFVLISARDASIVSARFPRPPTISERVKRFFNG